jgi:hypothetical protein
VTPLALRLPQGRFLGQLVLLPAAGPIRQAGCRGRLLAIVIAIA